MKNEIIQKLTQVKTDIGQYDDVQAQYIAVIKAVNKLGGEIKDQKEFAECYTALFNIKAHSQGTISRNFQMFNIMKDENGNYAYYRDVPDEETACKYFISKYCNTVSKPRKIFLNDNNDIYFIRIRTSIGYEVNVCQMIHERFEGKYYILQPGYGSVVVVCVKEGNIKKIEKFFRLNINDAN